MNTIVRSSGNRRRRRQLRPRQVLLPGRQDFLTYDVPGRGNDPGPTIERLSMFRRVATPSCAVVVVAFCVCTFSATFSVAQTLSNTPSAQKTKTQSAKASEGAWPRTVTSGSDKFLIYQPQVDKWEGNRVYLYSAVEMTTGQNKNPTYGVIWFNARTEVDKINRLVTLDNMELTKVKFPVAPDKEPVLTVLLQKKLPTATKTISLDRLEAAVEADGEVVKGVGVKNDPPPDNLLHHGVAPGSD